MNAVKMLTEDHRGFAVLYQRFVAAQTTSFRELLARRLLHEAEVHIALEEKYLYPVARERSRFELDEHSAAKLSLVELAGIEVHDWRFEDLLGTFVHELLEHSKQEERQFFPALTQTMSRAELEALGQLIFNAREGRADELASGGLLARALSHVLTAWKGQLGNGLERVCSAMLAARH